MTYRSDWNRCTFYNQLSSSCYDSNKKVFKSKIGADVYIGANSMVGTSSQWAPKFGTQFLYDAGNANNTAISFSNFIGRHKFVNTDYEGWTISFWLYIPSTATTSSYNIFTLNYMGALSGTQNQSTVHIISSSRRPYVYAYDSTARRWHMYQELCQLDNEWLVSFYYAI